VSYLNPYFSSKSTPEGPLENFGFRSAPKPFGSASRGWRTVVAPQRKCQANDHKSDECEVHKDARGCSRPDNGHHKKNQSSAQVFQQEYGKQEGNQGAISNQDHDAQKAEDKLAQSPGGKK
jgi:hypothetical protein